MNANGACDSDGDLVIDLLDCDRSRLVDLDLFDTPEGIKFFRHHGTLHKAPSGHIGDPYRRRGTWAAQDAGSS